MLPAGSMITLEWPPFGGPCFNDSISELPNSLGSPTIRIGASEKVTSVVLRQHKVFACIQNANLSSCEGRA